MTTFDYPFQDDPNQDICDSKVCPSPSVSPNPSGLYCGDSLVTDDPSSSGCSPCSFENSDQNNISFLGGSVVGFNGKLGYGGSESYVTIDIATGSKSIDCETFEVYGETHNCFNPDTSCEPSASPSVYSGQLGYIYTFNIGSFCFRGILSNHDYVESDSGYRYKVTLSDGRQILSNVSVILSDLYIRVPEKLYPNVINVLYENESSVSNDCIDGKKCHDFGKSGNGHKGMILKKVLEKIDGKQIQIPITGACLEIDIQKIIEITPETIRVSSSESSVLELISLACEETGHNFIVDINGYTMRVRPISHKVQPGTGAGAPLFTFLSELSDNYVVYDRQYGEELTFENSNNLVIGDNKRYLVEIDKDLGSQCIKNDPGSILISSSNAIDASSVVIPDCIVIPEPEEE